MSSAAGAEHRAGARSDPPPFEEGRGRVVAEVERATVEPGQERRLRRLPPHRRQVLGQQVAEQPAVVGQRCPQLIQPGATIAQRGRVRDDAELARPEPGGLRQARQLVDGALAGDQEAAT